MPPDFSSLHLPPSLSTRLQQFIEACHPHLKPIPDQDCNHAAMNGDGPEASTWWHRTVRLSASFIYDFIFDAVLSLWIYSVSCLLTAFSANMPEFSFANIMASLGLWKAVLICAVWGMWGLMLQCDLRRYQAAQAERRTHYITSSSLIVVTRILDEIYFYNTEVPIWLYILAYSFTKTVIGRVVAYFE